MVQLLMSTRLGTVPMDCDRRVELIVAEAHAGAGFIG